ncbi:MAG TPA: hypothetical protein VK085_11475 [Pseudogracilibacillus sp.]|nr:hypothetical protein [Pseudogracilibacillus sp.]
MINYIKSDIELKTTTVWMDGKERIDGFYFYSKTPFSKLFQWHSSIGLENTYTILKAIQKAIKIKARVLPIEISSGMGIERVYIWRGSLKKAEKQMFEMIKKIQKQY